MEPHDALLIAAAAPMTLAVAVLDVRAMVIIEDCPCTPDAVKTAIGVLVGGIPGAPMAMCTHGPPLGPAVEAELWAWLAERCEITDWLVIEPGGARSVPTGNPYSPCGP